MYIPKFVCGVIVGVIATLAVLVFFAVWTAKKKKGKKDGNED